MHEVRHFIRKQVRKRPPVCAGAVKANGYPCCRLSRYSGLGIRPSCISARCMPEVFWDWPRRCAGSHSGHQRLVIVTVGLADPDIPQNRENIRNALQKQIPAQLYGRAAVFHLRGAIDYQALSLGHRTMMALLHRSLQRNRRKNGAKKTRR